MRGKVCLYQHEAVILWDHPRLCGEKFSASYIRSFVLGSPPPMRGKGKLLGLFSVRTRITPAYAGKSLIAIQSLFLDKDHPRLCGEKVSSSALNNQKTGSPPPMRGKVSAVVICGVSCGITPAYAGKSTCESYGCIYGKDHPRLCGEKTKKIPKQRYFFHQPASFSFSLQYT